MGRLRARLTYANVMATIAVFIALGGTAVGASFLISKNSQLGPGTVSGSNPPKGKHANVIKHSVGVGDLGPGVLPAIAWGAADRGGDPICDQPAHCPLVYNRNVTGVRLSSA